MAAGVDPASLHPFHRLPAATHLKNEPGGTTIPTQAGQHSGGRSTQAELRRRAGASSISGLLKDRKQRGLLDETLVV